MLKIKYSVFDTPRKNETSLVFQKFKLNNCNMDYAIWVTQFLLILLSFGVS